MATVLAVDDAMLVLHVTERMLAVDGYEVLTATSATDALEILRSQRPIDLLITDLVLPDSSGMDLIARSIELRPALSTIMMTGDPGRGGADFLWNLAEMGIKQLLRKPFTHQQLKEAVEAALPSV